MNQNIQYFKWYCELNKLPIDESWISIAEYIEQSTKTLVSYSRWSYVFEWFDKYCRGSMDLEIFMTLWDGVNAHQIIQHPLASQAMQAIQTQLRIHEDGLQWSLVVIDAVAALGYDTDDIKAQLTKRWSELMIVAVGTIQDDEELV